MTQVSKPEEIRDADVVHVYTSRNVASSSFRGIKMPIVANVAAKKGWFSPGVTVAISPIEEPGYTKVPEAVEDAYWSGGQAILPLQRAVVSCYARPSLRGLIEQSAARIHRTRDDVEWLMCTDPPKPEDFAQVSLWVDPATDEHDFDGFVAEALVSGLPVVASRTSINVQRLEKGRTGLLVPPGDPNELAHAILSALFKPEVAQQTIDAASQTMAKFRARQRVRALTAIYESLK